MMKNQRGILHSRVLKVLVLMVLIISGIAIRFDFYYDLNDDTLIKDILSGAYTGTPSGYSIQMLYPLGAFIALFYRAIPGVSWYGLFLCLCQFGAIAVIAWRITGIVEKELYQVFALIAECIIIVGFMFRQIVMVQYSVASGMLMMAAIFLFTTSKRAKFRYNIVPIILTVLSFSIRTELCLMLMPFLLLAGFAKWMFDLKNTKSYIAIILSAIVCMAIVYSVDMLSIRTVDNSEQWVEFRRLFDNRTKIYDFYEIPDYDENVEFYHSIGMSKESYVLLKNYNYSLDDSINADIFEKIADYQEQQAQSGNNNLNYMSLIGNIKIVTKHDIRNALWLYKEKIKHESAFSYMLIAAVLVYVHFSLLRKRSGCWWKLLLLAACRSFIWIYLLMVDRMVDRITIPLYMAEITLILSWILYDETNSRESESKKSYINVGYYVIIAAWGIVALVNNYKSTATEYAQRELINPRWETLMDYCKEHPENYYLIDVYSSTSYDGVPYSEKMFVDVDNSYKNFDICGGWLAKSPLMHDKLKLSEAETIENDIVPNIYSDKVKFVVSIDRMGTDNMKWITNYYSSKEIEVNLTEEDYIKLVDTDNIFATYRLEKEICNH